MPDASSPPLEVEIRAPTPEELSLVKHSWFKSMQKRSDLGRLVRPDLFSPETNALITRLTRHHLPVVATVAGVPEEVIGWACRSSDTVFYVYVKGDFRRHGVATKLAFGSSYYAIRTPGGEAFAKAVKLLYNPFKLYQE